MARLTHVAIAFLPLGACLSVFAADNAQSRIPFQKKVALVDTGFGYSRGGATASSDRGIFIKIEYSSLGEQDISSATEVWGLTIAAPLEGAAPARNLNVPGYDGSVKWYEIAPNGFRAALNPTAVFRVGVAYTLEIMLIPTREVTADNPDKPLYLQKKALIQSDLRGQPSLAQTHLINGLQRDSAGLNPANDSPAPSQSVRANTGNSAYLAPSAIPTGLTQSYGAFSSNAPVSAVSNSSVRSQIVLPDLGGAGNEDGPKPSASNAAAKQVLDAGAPGQVANLPTNAPGAANALSNTVGPGAFPAALANPRQSGASAPVDAANMIPGVTLGDAGMGASIGKTATNFKYESPNYMAHLGIDYMSPKSNYGYGIKADGAALLGKTFGIGTNLALNQSVKEAVLSGVWMPKDTHVKAKLSAAYMWGSQNFDFYSGTSAASLNQASYYFSTQYVVPKEQSDYLHSVGVSTWGAKANQTNVADPVYTVVQNANNYQTMMDPRKLAAGTLQGESLDAQVGITKQAIAKASMGYESLTFPFSDGTQEQNKRIYQDYVVQYQPIPELALQAGYKLGAAMNNVMLSAVYGQWRLSGFKNSGNNGVTGNQGVLLSYSLPLDGKPGVASAASILSRPELIGNSSYILRDAATRPVQMPQAFLAKVDTTAVKTVATINTAGLPPGAAVNAAGDIVVLVGAGGGTITQVTRNGASYAYTPTFQIVNGNLVIRTRSLPAAAASGDAYVISITDSAGTPYLVKIATQN